MRDQARDRPHLAVRFEKAFAQMNEMAFRLRLARAAQIGGRDDEAGERILPTDQHVVRDDACVLERKCVERALQFLPREQERHGEIVPMPAVAEGQARGEVGELQAVDDRAGVKGSVNVVSAVGDEGPKPSPEHAFEVAREHIERSPLDPREVRHRRIIVVCGGRAADIMDLRTFNIGCFGGGTGLPSLLGGLKRNPWLTVNAVVTMFDSGGSSGVLRDELGVLPPGDVLRCALALARNEREARRVLLARLPTLEHTRLSGHTGGNLLLSMMQQYSGDFLAAVDGLRALLGCEGRVWPVSIEQATLCAEYGGGARTRGEVEVDAGQSAGHGITRLWLEPDAALFPPAAEAIAQFEGAIVGPGSFFTSLMPIFLVKGAADAVRRVRGPIVLVTNLLTEGRGMHGFTAGTAVQRLSETIGRQIDVVVVNTGRPSEEAVARYAHENKAFLEIGEVPRGTEVVSGDFWRHEIARHDRRRLAYAVWAVLARRLL
jgi:uncharacterized cofD-like protein